MATRHILILQGHPDTAGTHFGHALADRYRQGALAASPEHRLINVGDDTVRWTEELQVALEGTAAVVTLERFPDPGEPGDEGAIPPEVRNARVLYIRSQLGHMPLVSAGLGLPYVLRLLPAEILPDAPWRQPLGLPPLDAGLPDSVGP